MKTKIVWKVAVIAVAVFLLTAAPSCDLLDGNGNDVTIAPAFEEEELFSGEVMQYPGEWTGKVTYLNFFSMG